MPNHRIFVGGLPHDCREKDIARKFSKYGKIKEIFVNVKYAFVEFHDYRDAEDCIDDTSRGLKILDKRCTVEFSKRKPFGERDSGYGRKPMKKYRLMVDNLTTRYDWKDLKMYFRKTMACQIIYTEAHKNVCKVGQGLVDFAHRSDAEYCLRKLNNVKFNGKPIELSRDYVKPGRDEGSESCSDTASDCSERRERSRSPVRKSKRKSTPQKSESDDRSPSERRRSRSPVRRSRRKSSESEDRSPPRRKRSRRRHSESDSD